MPLSRDVWIAAALAALARDGIAGVAVEPLARGLGASKGSFYWHFADRAELIDAALELWEQRETTDVIEQVRAIHDPRERLNALGVGAYAGAARGNANAAVLAAAGDPRVRAVLERVTRVRLAFLERLYSDLGVAAGQTARHARLAYAVYLGIGELRRADPDPNLAGEELDAYLELAVQSMMPPDGAEGSTNNDPDTHTEPDLVQVQLKRRTRAFSGTRVTLPATTRSREETSSADKSDVPRGEER